MWQTIRKSFINDNQLQSKNKRKYKRKNQHKKHFKNLFSTEYKSPNLNLSFQQKNVYPNASKTSKRLFRSDTESDGEIQDVLANICTNGNFNITSKSCNSPPKINKENSFCNTQHNLEKKIEREKLQLLPHKNSYKSPEDLRNIIQEDYSSDECKSIESVKDVDLIDDIIIEDSQSSIKSTQNCQHENEEIVARQRSKSPKIDECQNESKEIFTCSQKSDLFPKVEEFNIEYISSITEKNTPNDKTISTQISEDDDNKSLGGEKELDLLIRDLQTYPVKEKPFKAVKGGYVQKYRNILKSAKSNYNFWRNELENLSIKYGILGEIIAINQFFGQTLLKISQQNEYVLILTDLNSKIYKGQNFYIGSKIIYDIESEHVILNNGEKVFLGVRKILQIK